jgi:hypothetical protein
VRQLMTVSAIIMVASGSLGVVGVARGEAGSQDTSSRQIGKLGYGDHNRSVLRRSFLFRSFSPGQVTHQNNVGRSWCLHDYPDDEVDCSYSNRSQCAATAAGGLGECSPN